MGLGEHRNESSIGMETNLNDAIGVDDGDHGGADFTGLGAYPIPPSMGHIDRDDQVLLVDMEIMAILHRLVPRT